MSNEFMRSNAKLDAVVIDATTGPGAGYENMRAAMRAQLQADGVIARDRENELGMRLLPGQYTETPAPRLEERDTRPINAERVLYLSGNSRIVITSADGEAALDAMEEKVRASLGAQR